MATLLDAQSLVDGLSSPYLQKRYKGDDVTESNLYKLARAVATGFHAETGTAVDALGPQRFDVTATEGFLDKRGTFWNVPRQTGQTDGALRLRIGQQRLVRWGAFNVDEMITLLATLLNTDVSVINAIENVDEVGDYEPALIQFPVDPAIFTELGITDVAAAIEDLESVLERSAPAGVRVRIVTQGTALWDDEGTVWDLSGTWSEGGEAIGSEAPPPELLPEDGGEGSDPTGEDPIGEG